MNGELPELPPKTESTNHIIGIIQNCLDRNPHNRPLPYMIFRHLTDTSIELFPDTNMIYYDNYRNKVSEQTYLNNEAEDYTETNDSIISSSINDDLFQKMKKEIYMLWLKLDIYI